MRCGSVPWDSCDVLAVRGGVDAGAAVAGVCAVAATDVADVGVVVAVEVVIPLIALERVVAAAAEPLSPMRKPVRTVAAGDDIVAAVAGHVLAGVAVAHGLEVASRAEVDHPVGRRSHAR